MTAAPPRDRHDRASRPAARERFARGTRLVLLAAPTLVACAWQLARLWNFGPLGHLDFRIYYGAAAQHGSLYRYAYAVPPSGHDPRPLQLGFTYPPFAALVLRPLTALGVVAAEHAWLILSVVASALFAYLCVRALPGATRPWVRSVGCAFILVSMPVRLTLELGQVNGLIALLMVVEVWLLGRESRGAGVGLGLAGALKITPGFLVVVLALSGRVRAATVALITALTVTVLAASVYFDDSRRYFTDTMFDTHRVGDLGAAFSNSLRRLVEWLHLGSGVGTAVWILLSAAVLAVVVHRARQALANGNPLAAITLGALGSYLVSPISWGHHLYFLPPALVLVAVARREWWRWPIVAAGAFLAVDPVTGGEGATYSFWRIVLLVTLLVVVPTRRASWPVDPFPSAKESARDRLLTLRGRG
jgi:alpha-1,2-mannosyltransferase